MKRILFITLALLSLSFAGRATSVIYTPDNTTVFPNPERGFTVQVDPILTVSQPNAIRVSDSWFSGGEKDNIRLVLTLYYLNNFKSQDLPQEILDGFDADMQRLRDVGWKCILRFAYSKDQNDNVDATPAWVQRHLEQLGPHLVANADVIYVMEAGFIGVWGEWYYTANYTNKSQHMNSNRRLVVDALFANAPTDRFVLFRTPMSKFEYYNDMTALSSAEAFTGTMRARWGHHNDAFLATYGDAGTYAGSSSDDPAVRQYVADETFYVPNGGETNVTNDDRAEAMYAQAPEQMGTYHWSFCGNGYAEAVTNRWRNSGLYDTLNIHMGYRYNLLDGTYSDEVQPGGKMNITIHLRNAGYAPIYNQRTAYIVLKNNSGTYSLPLSADPRRWLPNNVVSAINEQVTLPGDIPTGTYHLYLHLPDAYSSLADDPRYAVRLANVGVWDSATGLNDLGADVEVSTSAPDPGPEPEPDPEAITPGAQTLSAAINAASAGDVILLGSGIYSESSGFSINKSLTIKAANGATPVIKPSATISLPDNVTVRFIGVKFDLSNESSYLINATGTSGDNCLMMEGCEVYNFNVTAAIILCAKGKKCDYCLINNCKFYNDKKSCVFLENTDSKFVSVTNSSFYNISEPGTYTAGIIDVRTATGMVRVDHCTFYNCPVLNSDLGCVGKVVSTNAEVTNNICVMPASYNVGRAIRTNTGNQVRNCLTYRYTYSVSGIRNGNDAISCLMNVDPMFVNEANGDYHLQLSSPCINYATDGSHLGDPRWWPVGSVLHITVPAEGMTTYVTSHALDFSGIASLKAYVATSADVNGVTLAEVGTVPAGTPLILMGDADIYDVPVVSETLASVPETNLLRAGDDFTVFSGATADYSLSDGLFAKLVSETVAYGQAYLHLENDLGATLVIKAQAVTGDVNGDGIVNVMDATSLIGAYLKGTTSTLSAEVADVNHDGVINVMDATEIINIFLHNGN